MASYVLTMHPAAARSIEEFWALARLPKIDHMSRQNDRVTVVLKPIEHLAEGEQLLIAYLDQFASPDRRPGQLLPFDKGAVRAMVEQTNGRPGHLLQMAHGLVEHGARNQWASIGAEQVLTFVRDHGDERRVAAFPRKSGIGSIE